MDIKQVKELIASKIEALDKEFARLVNEESRTTAADYIKPAQVEGKINALTELLMEIDRS